MSEKIGLYAPGCLGTCWYGKYHYAEPYCGCAHDCVYCYAKSRAGVTEKLAELGTSFGRPVPMLPEAELLARLRELADSGELKTVKLSRFTDIFSAPFADNGLAFKVLDILSSSRVERIIITTKGVPSDETLGLISSRAGKFSYNVVAKPDCGWNFEKNAPALDQRLKAAARLCSEGVKTTVHCDPIIPGFEDKPELVAALLDKLSGYGLKRFMFSYLLVNAPILEEMGREFGAEFVSRMSAQFTDSEIQMLPRQSDTFYASLKPEIKAASVRAVSALLTQKGFEFVLCSLKSGSNAADCGSRLCDGSFYA